MKALRHNKVLGLAIGERSLLVTEVFGGDAPRAGRMLEFNYPAEISGLDNPEQLGVALGNFLRANQFSAKHAVIGIPARWLVVKSKEIPPADAATTADLLRLQTEGEFSSELKDLVYDYAGESNPSAASSVLLIATQKKYVDAAVKMCDSAKLVAVVVTSSAAALGMATHRVSKTASLVLAAGSAGAELTTLTGNAPSAIRYVRGNLNDRKFIGELRRAVSAIPSDGSPHELVLWDHSNLDLSALSDELGLSVHRGGSAGLSLAVTDPSVNGEAGKFAAAVALGLIGIGAGTAAIDFLHSRLAPVSQKRIPQWMLITTAAAVLLGFVIFLAYYYVGQQQAALDKLNETLARQERPLKSANEFVTTASLAQNWHGGNPRYLQCMQDLTEAIPEDRETYATSLLIRELPPPPPRAGVATEVKPIGPMPLSGVLYGKTTNQQKVQIIIDRLSHTPGFTDVKLGGTDAGRSQEVAFSIVFTYAQSKAKH